MDNEGEPIRAKPYVLICDEEHQDEIDRVFKAEEPTREPKKPIPWHDLFSGRFCGYCCPACKRQLPKDKTKPICGNCGQRLDWNNN